MRDKLLAIEKELNRDFYERKDVIRGLMVGLLARQHVLLLGPPGTAKSDLVEAICSRIDGAYFRWLITRFSVPEEIFGPVSLKALEQDQYKRITTNKLPEAQVVFLDEVFKGSSSILNTLLTAMNERLFFNNGTPTRMPMEMLVGASNELPEDALELGALWDRFLLRYQVGYIRDKRNFEALLAQDRTASPAPTTITPDELFIAQHGAMNVDLHKVIPFITALRDKMATMQIPVSDRRWRQLLSIIRAHAYLEGRTEAADEDLVVLAASLWQEPNQIAQVRQAILELANPLDMEAQDLLDQAMEIHQAAMIQSAGESEQDMIKATQVGTETIGKLKFVAKKLKKLLDTAAEKNKSDARIKETAAKLADMIREVQAKCLGMTI
jgi:MoxR-like ATPase